MGRNADQFVTLVEGSRLLGEVDYDGRSSVDALASQYDFRMARSSLASGDNGFPNTQIFHGGVGKAGIVVGAAADEQGGGGGECENGRIFMRGLKEHAHGKRQARHSSLRLRLRAPELLLTSKSFAMPTYEYECKKCGKTFDVFQSMKDEPLTVCPDKKCKGKVKRLIGPAPD